MEDWLKLFYTSKLASCQIRVCFPLRNWCHAKFAHVSRFEIGVVPSSRMFLASKLPSCQIHSQILYKKTPHMCEVSQLYYPRHWILILIQAFNITRR